MGSILGISGDSVTFRNHTISALVDRTQNWGQPAPATFVEILSSAVSSIPVAGEQFLHTYGATHWAWTILFVKPINGWYRCECYCLKDTPKEEVTIDGHTLDCYAFSAVYGTDLELGGLTNQNAVRLLFDSADLDGISYVPSEGDPVTFRSGSIPYRVARVQVDQPGAPVIVDIADEAGGRR